MNPEHRPTLVSCLRYKDPRRALKWLEEAFGFEQSMVILGPNDEIMHSEMRMGDGLIMVGAEWPPRHKSPANIDGCNTQAVHVELKTDVDAHCARARKAGAKIEQEPETQPYGHRTYRCLDIEGHMWTFGQEVKLVTEAELDKEMGTKTKTRI